MYKIKHKPTGLYYQPSRGSGNLSTKGKTYDSKPNLKSKPELITIRLVLRISKQSRKKQNLIFDFLKAANLWESKQADMRYGWLDTIVTTKLDDWEVVDVFSNKTDELYGLTYEKLIAGLPLEVSELIGKDDLVTKAFEEVKKNPYVGFAYLLGVIQSWREFKERANEIDAALEQFKTCGLGLKHWSTSK